MRQPPILNYKTPSPEEGELLSKAVMPPFAKAYALGYCVTTLITILSSPRGVPDIPIWACFIPVTAFILCGIHTVVLGATYLLQGLRFWRRYAATPPPYLPWVLGAAQGGLFAFFPFVFNDYNAAALCIHFVSTAISTLLMRPRGLL